MLAVSENASPELAKPSKQNLTERVGLVAGVIALWSR
jgi:hypothetical protein